MKKDPVLSCRNLSFSYGEKTILENVSLDFWPGEFVGLLGCNGAGKSTLLSCLGGLLPSRFDNLSIDGLNLGNAGRRDIARRLSMVPQEHENMFPFSVLEVVVMGRTAFLGSFGAPGKDDTALAEAVLAELRISGLAQRVYTSLSGGEKQMVLLARALAQTRKIVFLDEPTNHLDYRNRYQMLSQLKSLSRDSGSCVVACLHDPNHALLFADRVILLEQGRILAEGPARDVLTGETVSRLYGIAAGQNDASGLNQIFPVFVHPGFKGRVLLLTGRSGEGKTTLLTRVVKENRNLDFGGIICPGTFKNGRRYSSRVRCLGTGAWEPFATRQDEEGAGPFAFHRRGRALADLALEPCTNQNRHCVVVDEVGPLELKGGGHASLLPPLLSLDRPRHIWAVRPEIVAEVRRRWMLADPVIVEVSRPDAMDRVCEFLYGKGESCA